jgi:hypothetical protein
MQETIRGKGGRIVFLPIGRDKKKRKSRQLCKRFRTFAAELQQKEYEQDDNSNIKYNCR